MEKPEEKKKTPQGIMAYLAIVVGEDAFEKAERFTYEMRDAPSVSGPREVVVAFRGEKVEMTMREFLETLGFENLPCERCGGTGEVDTVEAVNPGEPEVVAPVGTGKCPECQEV